MIEITRILCPVDFSEHSGRALAHAVALARWYRARVVALHVLSGAGDTLAPEFEPVATSHADRERAGADLDDLIAARSAPGVTIEPVLRKGQPAAEILAHAAVMRADLVVLGTHGRSGFEHLLLGSVTEKVLRKAGCPVLTVPNRVENGGAAVVFTRVLCPMDFSDTSLRALEYALSLARESAAHLIILHVISHELNATPDVLSAADMAVTVAEFRRRREEEVNAQLAGLVPADVPDACVVETMAAHGKPWREILRVAAEQRSDLVVMGVQGRGPIDLMLFGSTTEQVVRRAVCPVLTLRQPAH